MFKNWICSVTLAASVMGLAACSSSQKNDTYGVLDAQPVTIQSRVAGSSEKLANPDVILINDAQALEALQVEALSSLSLDFKTQSVIILSLGQCPTGGYWVHIDGVQTLGRNIFVQGTANKPADGTQTEALTYPFEAIVVGKVQGKIVSDVTSVEDQEHPSHAATAVDSQM